MQFRTRKSKDPHTRPGWLFANAPWLVASAYAFASVCWIFFSDRLLISLSPSLDTYQELQTYKGWGFVILSALLIYYLMALAWRGMVQSFHSVAESERQLNLALESAGGGIWEIDLTDDTRGFIHHFSAVSTRLGLAPDAPVSMDLLLSLAHPDDAPEAQRQLEETISAGGQTPYSVRFRLRTIDGSYMWLQASGNVIRSADGQPSRVLGVMLDVTEQIQTQEALDAALRFDTATGLLTQQHFLTELDQLIEHLPEDGCAAVVQFRIADIDTLVGDNECLQDSRLIRLVGDRLRAVPNIVAARFSQDVFAFAAHGPSREAAIRAATLACAQGAPSAIDLPRSSKKLQIQCGGAVGSPQNRSAIEIVRNSGHAMEMAERSADRTIQWFNREMREEFDQRTALILALQSAVAHGEIACHFQPVVDLAAARTASFEALARWQRSSGEMVAPDVFIPLAEEHGLIDEIGEIILTKACSTAVSWGSCGPAVCVNVSPLQLDDEAFPSMVARILAETGLPPDRLELEITESALAKNLAIVVDRIRQLRQIGVDIAIDDFGTGYSSLSLLSRIPFTRLKIDRMFVSGANMSGRQDAICDLIISLAHSVDLAVTAEGVETIEQARMLAGKGVECAQGYYFSRPVDAESAAPLANRDWSDVLETTRVSGQPARARV